MKTQAKIVKREKAFSIDDEILLKYSECQYVPDEGKLRRIFRRITLNGLLLSSTNKVKYDRKKPFLLRGFNRKAEILFYNSEKKYGYIVKRSFSKTIFLACKLLCLVFMIKVFYDKKAGLYRKTFCHYVSKEFWERYLKKSCN